MFTFSAHVSWRKQYLLTRPQKTINFCDKTVIFNFKIVLFSESLYFHLYNKNTESHGKNLILRILRKMSCNVSLMSNKYLQYAHSRTIKSNIYKPLLETCAN